MSFFSFIGKEAGRFKDLPKDSNFLICAHFDCDGICAATIFSEMLDSQGMKHQIRMKPFLDKRAIEELTQEDFDYYIFLDMGSSKLSLIEKIPAKKIYVLDHHRPEDYDSEKIVHINPYSYDDRLAGAGVAYLFAKEIYPDSKSELAIVGAIGDNQGKKGFTGINKQILEEAIKKGKIKVIESIRLFGTGKRNLTRLLKHTDDPYIPGITGNENEAAKFLKNLGISTTEDGKDRYFRDLSDDEIKSISDGIIELRKECKDPEDIFGPLYILPEEEYDAKEFATVLNACGRLGYTDIGIGLCKGEKEAKDKAYEISQSYKNLLTESIEWVRQIIIRDNFLLIINATDKIPPEIIGTISSIIAYSDMSKYGDVILSLSRKLETKETKVSMRISGARDIDLSYLLKELTKSMGNVSGGHKNAAGAVIPTSLEEMFIRDARKAIVGTIEEDRVVIKE